MDQPPRQVLVEARVLQVTLKDDNRHGVNFESILRVANSTVSLKTKGFANPAASPAFFLGVGGTDLDLLIEALQTTTDAKTLASSRILAINGQEAKIQIGAQLGYLVTTTTQTSTMQEVNFLDLGVVLNFTPQISADDRILLTVKPEVSSGRINPETGLPEEDTTEVQTTIMLNDGQGMIIGGLIKESDTDSQTKIPIIGDLWMVGKLFQRQTVTRERNEIIIALVPRIVPYDPEYSELEDSRLMQATTQLMDEKLRPVERPWEGKLPDAMKDPRRLKVRRLPHAVQNLSEEYPNPPKYYVPSVSEEREEFERSEAFIEEDAETEESDDDDFEE
ncbi:MAG: type II secretion system protein GspD [Planctomycetaceae bacterium]